MRREERFRELQSTERGAYFCPNYCGVCLLADSGAHCDAALRVSAAASALRFSELWSAVTSNTRLQSSVASSQRVPHQVTPERPEHTDITAAPLEPQMHHIYILRLKQKHLCDEASLQNHQHLQLDLKDLTCLLWMLWFFSSLL